MDIELSQIIIPAVALLFILEIAMVFFIWRTNKRITQFFNGKDGKSIEKVLEFEMRKMKKTQENIRELTQNVKWMEGISRKSVHKVGVVRFNPFRDIGGDQSFSIALLDYGNNGTVISSLHSAEGTRVYAKPVVKGESKYSLTEEELAALRKATGRRES